uniref:Retrotransposon gag domain-containing protein n=1 Tax=Cajanus cajan TaxID=3821 RepID=A0A151U2X1_CAJCA|nr:hypothetical protein KK1_006221 [Cajanus cajan]
MKLDFPKFDGSEPLNWLFRAEQFFALYQTPEPQRLAIAAIHMEGDAGPWFQMLQKMNLLPNWQALVQAVEAHFGPSPFDSPRAALFKLQQIDSVQNYYHQFSSLANHVEGLTDAALLDCFINGLKSDIKREVLVQLPTSLVRAVALAKLYDAKPTPTPHYSKNRFMASTQNRINSPLPSSQNSSLPGLLPTPKMQALPTPTSSHSIKRMTAAEMQIRRDRGLCYTCDEKFTPSHRCPNRQFLFLLQEDDMPPNPLPLIPCDDYVPIVEESVAEFHHLSHSAFHGASGPGTLRFHGLLFGHEVQVLLDSGSSDNFVQPRLAKFLQLPIENAPNFKVLVGNGNYLTCEGRIRQVPLSIQGHTIHLSAFLLPVSGAEIILGASWLSTLGAHVADYSTLTIKFFDGSEFVTLQGDSQRSTSVM